MEAQGKIYTVDAVLSHLDPGSTAASLALSPTSYERPLIRKPSRLKPTAIAELEWK
jgi:hypothetical protein